MEREWTEREKLLAACAASHIPLPEEKSMDTSMTPRQLAEAIADQLVEKYSSVSYRASFINTALPFIVQRDALLMAEITRGYNQTAAITNERLSALEEENARLFRLLAKVGKQFRLMQTIRAAECGSASDVDTLGAWAVLCEEALR